jgi:tetratricopeptide (TPR) repeat protein
MLQDESYILPYQILSYAHFLTNNRDTAIEYFLKLANFDKKNTEMYQFLVGVSYYRKNDFTSSILYLAQNKSPKYQTDTLRYLIINYLEIDEYTKAIESWQKILGQTDIKNSDFFLYFYNSFYKGYFSQNRKIYETNEQLATLFIQECEKKL